MKTTNTTTTMTAEQFDAYIDGVLTALGLGDRDTAYKAALAGVSPADFAKKKK